MNKTALKIFLSFIFLAAATAIIMLLINCVGLALLLSDKNDIYSNSQRYILDQISENMTVSEDGLMLSDRSVLPEENWAMVIDAEGDVIWELNRPDDVPDSYSINDIARMTRWFLNDYPVFVRTEDYGLLVLGAPKDSMGKFQIRYSMEWFESFPERALSVVAVNLILSTVLAVILGWSLYKRLKDITAGLACLRMEKRVNLVEKGLSRDISMSINEISRGIERKNEALLERDSARANWIAGISHDIRTPLSVVMGYSEEIASSNEVPEKYRKKAALITERSVKIKKLIEDLNLISSLEYDMQPAKKRPVRLCPLLRLVVSEILDNGPGAGFTVNLNLTCERAVVSGDEALLERAFFNIINNAIVHNPDGCDITIDEYAQNGRIYVRVKDNGKGLDGDIIKNIGEMPRSSHGLGLPMAFRIIKVHGGKMELKNDSGLTVLIELTGSEFS